MTVVKIWSDRSSENSSMKYISWLLYIALRQLKALCLYYHTTLTVILHVVCSHDFKICGWLPSAQNIVHS